jgi:hypothetical protein
VRAREYLVSVFEDQDEDLADRMNAIKASRKVEAAKVSSPKVVHLNRRTAVDRKEAWREYERHQLKKRIIKATGWVPTTPGWDAILTSPDYLPPEGDAWPPWWDEQGRRRR